MKWLKRIGIGFLVGVAALALLLVGVGYFFQDKLIDLFVKEINKQLVAEVSMDKMVFSAWKQFPDATIEFQEITCMEGVNYRKADTLFSAQSLFLNFNILDLIRGRYIVDHIELSNGQLALKEDVNGEPNYMIWKPSEKSDSASSFQLNLKSIHLSNVDFSYHSIPRKRKLTTVVDELEMKGDFAAEGMRVEAYGTTKQLTFSDPSMTTQNPVDLDLNVVVQSKDDTWLLEESRVKWNQTDLTASGTMRGDAFDLTFSGTEIDISEILPYLPESWKVQLATYQPKGKMAFSGTLKGEGKTFSSNGSFSLTGAQLVRKDNEMKVKNLEVTGDFNFPGRKEKTRIHLKQVSGNLNNGNFKGELVYENLTAPQVDLQVSANLDWADFMPFIGVSGLDEAKGPLEAELTYRGGFSRAGKITRTDLNRAVFSGYLKTEGGFFSWEEAVYPYEQVSASLTFDNQKVEVNHFSAQIGQSDLVLNGVINNALGYVLVDNQNLELTADLKSNLLDFNEILAVESSGSSEYKLSFSPNLSANLNLEVGQMKFRRFEAKDITGKARLLDQVLRVDPLSMTTLDGTIQGNFMVNGYGNRLHLTGRTTLNHIDVQDLFYVCENFGQDYIRSDHLRGYATASIVLDTYWSENLVVDLDRFNAVGDVRIDQGELIQFEPMRALGSYVKLEELDHIRFQTLTNQITIRNRQVIIPQMDIKSSALTVEASGVHHFDNRIDYKFRLLLQELLTKKVRNEDPVNFEEHGVIRDDGLETSLYLSMTGTVDDFTIKYDRQGLKEKIKDEIQSEKEEVVSLIREELKGGQKADTSSSTPIKESGFTFEWDDEEEDPKDQ